MPKDKDSSQTEASEKETLLAINARLALLEIRISAVETEQRSQFKVLRSGAQAAFDQVGEALGEIQRSIAQLKKAAKSAPAPIAEKPPQPK